MSDNYTEGDKYQETKDLGIVEIAKLVRKDLKEAFPTYKFKVQTEKYAMGCSLHIQAQNTGLQRQDLAYYQAEKLLKNAIRAVADRYNYSDSDWQSDYHATKFYCNDVKVES